MRFDVNVDEEIVQRYVSHLAIHGNEMGNQSISCSASDMVTHSAYGNNDGS